MDNLSKDMIKCKQDGFGCHYGAWRAAQDPIKIEKKDIPDGWRVCEYCGTPFKPSTKRKQLYCGAVCQQQASRERAYEREREKKVGAKK